MTFNKGKVIGTGGGGDASLLAKQQAVTGLLSDGVPSKNAAVKVDITAGTGTIVDNSDPTNPIVTDVSFDAVNSLTVPVDTDGAFVLGFDNTGTFITPIPAGELTQQDRNDNILVGAYVVVGNPGGEIVEVLTAPLNLGYDGTTSSLHFLRDIIGPANKLGNDFEAASTDLTIKKSEGTTFIFANNFRTSAAEPDEMFIAASGPTGFLRVYRQASPSGNLTTDTPSGTTLINPTQYDNGSGILQTFLNNNQWSVQAIYISPSGGINVAYGQAQFGSKAEAQAAIDNGTFIQEEFISLQVAVRRYALILKADASDLSDTGQAVFVELPKYRGGAT